VGRQLYRAAQGASTCGPGAPRGRRRHAVVGLGVEPESSSRSGKDPTGGARLAVRERGRGERRVGPARLRGGKNKGWLGWALREEGERGKKKREWASYVVGRRIRKGRKRRKWAGPKEKERVKKKFKYKWKIKNKTMQCDMICTRPIFPYIYFYG
jgi:hypothetical protein